MSIGKLLRKMFLEDWLLKAVALAIAFALWLGVTGLSTPTTQRLTSVPLTLRFPTDVEVTNSPIQEVDLVVTGDKRKLGEINKNDLIASVDISDVMPGDRVINLTPDNVRVSLPTGVKLDEVQPNRIAVRVEPVEEKEVAVQVRLVGSVPQGFEVYSQTATPSKVRVRGPATFVRALEHIATEPIDLSDRTADFALRQVPIGISDPKVSLLSETVVDVFLRIGEKRTERLMVVPVADGSDRRASVLLFGGRSVLESLAPADLRVELVDGEDSPRVILPPELDGRVEVRSVRLRS